MLSLPDSTAIRRPTGDLAKLPEVVEKPILPELEDEMTQRWTWLIERDHPWRHQLWIKGRRVTAGDLALTLEIEGWTPELAAAEYELPVEAVREAVRYLAENRELVIAEEEENRLAGAGSTA